MDHLENELAKYGEYSRFGELVPADDLRARLLVVSQGIHDQYDRLEAEATFRINVAIPMVAFAVVLSASTPDPDWRTKLATVVVVALAALIFAQGIQKHRLSHGVLMRAVLADLVDHPSIVRARLMADEYPCTGEEEQARLADMRSFMRHELAELSRAHSMKAAADEQDDPSADRPATRPRSRRRVATDRVRV
ncbi:hypothetical protein [Kribbella sindirgiensis]|uniref:SLATT domain-containing protein n=1 Tax=Kribbella sindirgiensis TaxID=1124744 RepID=A0A4V2M338_9ACTN|nr:hypothetical protein [Kribbella sindirgiensis]TCC30482.1 hypothetical protein E0H50_24030 [Kribbella sindirgiensis]